jgi:DNA-binding beta-propeller fold protein YncE
MTRKLLLLAFIAFLTAFGTSDQAERIAAQAGSGAQAPKFQVDPMWPKPLPNHWLFGSITGVAVDAQDHIWVVHRGADSLNARTEIGLASDPPTAEGCCLPAPFVLEFDQAGNLVGHWGGPGQGYDWPQSPGGITVDAKGNVWIAAAGPPDMAGGRATSTSEEPGAGRSGAQTQGAGRGGRGAAAPRPQDAHVLKFSRTGKFLLQIGKAGQAEGSDSTTALNRPAAVEVDSAANEVYVADGFVNRRIVVFDAETGAFKRHWGAYGEKPVDGPAARYDPQAPPSKQFNTVSSVRLARDGLLYVCDRKNDRIQVFKKDGTFVKEGFVSKTTLGDGAVWDVAFSKDPQQRFLYVADGHDQKVWVLVRDTLEVVGSFGAGGRWPGHFYGVGSIAVDSKGSIYTGETYEGKRLQKFLYKGLGPATGSNQ